MIKLQERRLKVFDNPTGVRMEIQAGMIKLQERRLKVTNSSMKDLNRSNAGMIKLQERRLKVLSIHIASNTSIMTPE